METTKTNEDPKAKQWAAMISEWESSGISQPEFCRQRDLSYAAFRYWRHRLAKEQPLKDGGFVHVAKAGIVDVVSEASVKIHIDGYVVETDGRIGPERLGAILRAVRDL